MKTIGVLGGLGPQATMDFVARIHRVSQERLPQRGNMGYPPMVVYYCRFPPILVDEEMLPIHPIQPNPPLLHAARELGRVADFMVVTANGPHMLQPALEEASGLELLSMIDVTLGELEGLGWRRVGLLGLGEPRVYMRPLEDRGIAHITLQGEVQERLDRAILSVMEGADGDREVAIAREAVETLRREGAEGIIVGCTELPLLLLEEMDAGDLVNPAELLAEAAVEYAADGQS
jgi:aspartate racemase